MKIGDNVLILRKDIFHLKNWRGTIIDINGYCILVRPKNVKWTIELYPNEIKIN